ncbi:MAG: hypothetical protein Q9180_004129, partial [Flavoplaca navasiana]
MADLQGRKVFKVFNQDFIVDERYNVTKELGQGAYGIVCAATNNQTGEGVAIKKVTNVFSKKILAKRALREIKLLQHFRGHRNITCLYDMDIPRPDNFNETYLYEELMECDLAAIIRSGQPLTDAHFQSFIYQILCGLKYIHSANVLHRDLKPGNLLVNADCELKICDFGLARGFSMDPEENAGYMTEYVATRWYRAPEIMLSFQSYTKAIDVWSVGCILAELLGGRPFFKGRDYVDQLNQILHYLGTPNEETLSRIGSPRAQEYVRNLPFMPKVPFQRLFNNANPDALDLLDRMLAFDPSSRISVEEALEHRYLHIWHDASDEPNCPTTFDFHFEVVEDVPEMRKMILAEVHRFRQYVRVQQPQAQLGGPMGQAQSNVPIPDNAGQWSQEDPRPQEASAPHHTQNMGLEQELQGGLDAMHQVVMNLIPQGDNRDYTRVITLSPSAEPIIIGRASKTTSKGLLAAPQNAWFDSPIMSRQHGRISMTSTGVVQLQDLASTHGTWIRNKRLEGDEYRDIHDGDRITFGSTVTCGPASPTSSSPEKSDRSGFQVPEDQYESLSDDSDAEDCKILSSHPRTFSVPSSGDEMDESDDDPYHTFAIPTTRSNTSVPREIHESPRSSQIENLYSSRHVIDSTPQTPTKSNEVRTTAQVKPEDTPQMTTPFDDDTEDEGPTYIGQPKDVDLSQGRNVDSATTYSSSPEIEIPDTYASLDLSRKESVMSQNANAGRRDRESRLREALSEMVPEKETDQVEDPGHNADNKSVGHPSDASADGYDDDEDSLFISAACRGDAVSTGIYAAVDNQVSRSPKAPSPSSKDAFIPHSLAQQDNQVFPSYATPKPNNPHTASLDARYPHANDSTLKTARAPSPSDAALVRKAPSHSYYPATRLAPLAPQASLYNWATSEELSFTRPFNEMTMYSQPSNAFQSTSGYDQSLYDYAYQRQVYDNGLDHYQQGPFSRSYGLSHLATNPTTTDRWSSSPPPQAAHKSCLVKLKVDAKSVDEENQDLRSNLDEVTSKKVDISNLVNTQADGTRGLKRKSDQMSREEHVSDGLGTTLDSSSTRTVGEDDLGPHAQARDILTAGNETMSQGLVSDTTLVPISVACDATEQEPARKKIKISSGKPSS